MTIVANNVKRLIKERGLKQCALAEMAGYKPQAFSNMLNGRKVISEKDVGNLINVLDVEANDLFRIGEK